MYKLLVVDDEKLMRRGIIELIDMKSIGISEVFEATNGAEALETAKEKSPDIILADINMPIMNGLDFSREVKKILPLTKVAIITGYDYFDYAVSALKAGVDDYILKPITKDDISILLKKLAQKLHDEKSNKTAYRISEQINDLKSDGDHYKNEINRIIDKNTDNYDFSLEMLSNELSLSSGYLSSKFKDLFGLNFQDYMIKLRISKAKLLLLSTNMKIYEVASKTGFEDTNYFSAAFKRHTKLSPSEFRKSAGENNHEK